VVTSAREIAATPLQTIDIPVSLIADPVELKGRSIEVTFTIQATTIHASRMKSPPNSSTASSYEE